MALKEITDLAELTTGGLTDSSWLHAKDGGTDYKMRPQVLFDLYNSQTVEGEDNLVVTKADVGLATVTDDPQLKIASNLSDLQSASAARGNLSVDSSAAVTSKVDAHANLTNDPHNVTKAQVDLGNVPNYTISHTITDTSTTKFASINAVSQVNARVTAIEPNVIPSGAIVMWSTDTDIPAGWKIMDGTSGTIDMRGKFVRGGDRLAGGTKVGTEGGLDSYAHNHSATSGGHALSLTQIPAHKHHNGTTQGGADGGNGATVIRADPSFATPEGFDTNLAGGPNGAAEGVANTHNHTVSVNNNAAASQSNLPPYYTMIFIQKI